MKTAVVTGAAGELATSVIQTFRHHGWSVHGLVRRPGSSSIPSDERYREWTCDVGNPQALAQVIASLPVFNAFIHLVGGIQAGKAIEDDDLSIMEHMYALNTLSTFNALSHSIPILKQTAGSFVAIGAQAAVQATGFKGAYAASKAAVISLCLSAAEETRASGMRVNVVIPGILNTKANREWASEGQEKHWVDLRECAELIVALSSDDMRGVTGTLVPMLGR